jgi:stage II sporulation protein Q
MAKEKLKKVSLTREVKAAIVVSILAIFLFGGIMLFANKGEDDVVVVNPSVDGDNNNTGDIGDENQNQEPNTPVVIEEKLLKPFNVNAKTERYFFDLSDNAETQELSILEYKGKFTPSTAMEYSYNNTKFDVVASFSGVVTERKVDPLYGYMVYIKNSNGLTAIYGSLSDVAVNVGDNVKQGDVIAKSGTNTIDANLNNHLHFSLMKSSEVINPSKYYGQEIKNIG